MPDLAKPLRRLPLTGTYNLRDAGGYRAAGGRIRRAMLLRGDAPGELDPRSLQLLAEIGLRTAIDLRTPDERALRASGLTAVESLRVIELPLFDAADRAALGHAGLPAVYRWIVRERGSRLAAAVAALAAPDALPALVHCAAGKDRTGLVIGLVHALLGVDDDDIAADYGQSERMLGADFAAAVAAQARALGHRRAPDDALLASQPAWMRAVLELVRAEHGDAAGYLAAHGLTAEQAGALRGALVEPVAERSAPR